MKKLIITCHPTPRSTEAGMKRILSAVRDLAMKCGVSITWKEEPELTMSCGHKLCPDPETEQECIVCTKGRMP